MPWTIVCFLFVFWRLVVCASTVSFLYLLTTHVSLWLRHQTLKEKDLIEGRQEGDAKKHTKLEQNLKMKSHWIIWTKAGKFTACIFRNNCNWSKKPLCKCRGECSEYRSYTCNRNNSTQILQSTENSDINPLSQRLTWSEIQDLTKIVFVQIAIEQFKVWQIQ